MGVHERGHDEGDGVADILVGEAARAVGEDGAEVICLGCCGMAGLAEELMYRRFLQTRLEALAGRWTGILVASILFGLMHTFSHGDGALAENAVRAIAMNGTTGLALGVMWSRWRRIWVCVLAHVLLNGFGVLLHLVGLID